MGNDPKSSVTNRYGQVHEIDTLLALLNRARANLAEAPMPPAAPPGRAAPPRRRRNG